MNDFLIVCGALACLLVLIAITLGLLSLYEYCRERYWKRKFCALYKDISDTGLLLTLQYRPESRMSLIRVQTILASLIEGWDNPDPDALPSISGVSRKLSLCSFMHYNDSESKWLRAICDRSRSTLENFIPPDHIRLTYSKVREVYQQWIEARKKFEDYYNDSRGTGLLKEHYND